MSGGILGRSPENLQIFGEYIDGITQLAVLRCTIGYHSTNFIIQHYANYKAVIGRPHLVLQLGLATHLSQVVAK